MRQTLLAENTMPSVLDTLGQTVEFLQTAGLNPRSLFIAELALEELLTNILKYSYDDTEAHKIEVLAEVVDGTVLLELHDDGHEFDPRRPAETQAAVSLLEMKPGGNGIRLVVKLVPDLDYRREGGWNVLKLRFPAVSPATTAA